MPNEELPPLGYARQLLIEEQALLAAVYPAEGGRGVFTAKERGIMPLLRLLGGEGAGRFRGASFADKIVGKAAAMLYVRLGVKEVYGEVMTDTAHGILAAHGIRAEWGTLTERIINRAGTDICPMEKAVEGISDPAAAEAALRRACGLD